MHENRPSEGPFYGVCGTVHAGMTLLMLLSASVSRTATERRLIMLAQYIYSIVQLMRQYSSRRSSTELHDSSASSAASSSGAVGLQVSRPASTAQARRLRDRRRVRYHPSRCIARGRATTSVHRSSASAVAQRLHLARSRQLNFGRKGFGAISSRLVPAIVPILGWLGQELDRIGANGFMVLRLRVP